MVNFFLADLVTYGLQTNIVTNSGVGVLLFSREKKYNSFRYINTLFLMLGIAICSIATYFLDKFVLVQFELAEFRLCVAVVIAACYHLLISRLWKRISHFKHYLYENSCTYVFDLVFTIFVEMYLDMTLEIVPFLLSVGAVLIAVFVVNIIVGFFIEGINKSSLNINIRNVAARLFLIAIFAMILYYANMLV